MVLTNEMLGRALDLGLDARTQAVKDDDLAETAHLERDGVDGHALQDLEELMLNVERWERLVRKRLEPSLDAFEEVVVEDGLLQMVPVDDSRAKEQDEGDVWSAYDDETVK